ncbi:MAG: hypothetical protein QGF00_24320 [Planctomycetota bacterium]|jgi:predicted DNA-binding antitoxin AbrB/MazE fold protein|nr:hypothetical protein [Planctomycetota bacterium]MDP7252753.1 hypothetical protein [Planctomycetota bacterium]
MSRFEFTTTVSEEGILSVPEDVPLESGKEVKVTLEWQEMSEADAKYYDALRKRMTPEQFERHIELERKMQEMMAEVELPRDLSQNLNRYLYGGKRP